MSLYWQPAPLALPASVLAGFVVSIATFMGGEALHFDGSPLLAIPIALGLTAAALTRRLMHRRALERAARDHNAQN